MDRRAQTREDEEYRRRNKARSLLSQAYEAPYVKDEPFNTTEEQEFDLPALTGNVASQKRVPGGFNTNKAIELFAANELGPEAYELQKYQEAPTRELQSFAAKEGIKAELEQAVKDRDWKRIESFLGRMGSGGAGGVTKITMSEKGPGFEMDTVGLANAKRQHDVDRINTFRETGRDIGPFQMGGGATTVPDRAGNVPRGTISQGPVRIGPDMSALPPKQQEEIYRKRVEEMPQAKAHLEYANSKSDNIISAIDQLIGQDETKPKPMQGLDYALGLSSYWMPATGGSAANADAIIQSLKSQLSTQAMQEMRDASKTGGAVGNVTEKEWPRLESLIGTLNQRQTPEQFIKQLNIVRSEARKIKARSSDRFASEYGAPRSGSDQGVVPFESLR
jgi:hypothetical protein